jgi:hypothetical protein
MDTRNDTFDLTPWIGDGRNDERPANDADSTDQRFNKLLIAFKFWKYMPAWRIKSQTFAERIEREAMLQCIREFEARHGLVI